MNKSAGAVRGRGRGMHRAPPHTTTRYRTRGQAERRKTTGAPRNEEKCFFGRPLLLCGRLQVDPKGRKKLGLTFRSSNLL